MRLAVLLAILALGAAPAPALALDSPRVVPESRVQALLSFSPVVKRAQPAVVNVYASRAAQKQARNPIFDDPVFRQFFGEDGGGHPGGQSAQSLGSGVIVDASGLVITNHHVIEGMTEVKVVLADKREFDAKVIAEDEKNDIAVLKLSGGEGHFPFLAFEDSDTLEVGDLVLAIGNPFGVGQTVTSGIVSALARTEIGSSDAQIFIQTDAAINPGNSGGALVDMSGKLVGINTAIYSRDGGSNGIGFAIPSNLIRVYLDSALSGKKLEKPWLGAKLEAVTRDIAEGLSLERITGAVVTRVNNVGPAADAKLLPGDVILRVDGFEVTDGRAVLYRLQTKGVGQTAHLELIRKNKPLSLDIALKPAPQPGKDDIRNLSGKHPLDGARVANLLPGVADEMGLDETSGVAIVSVRPGSIAARLGFQPGDIIAEVGGAPVDDILALETAVRDRQRVWSLAVKRGGQILQLQVPG